MKRGRKLRCVSVVRAANTYQRIPHILTMNPSKQMIPRLQLPEAVLQGGSDKNATVERGNSLRCKMVEAGPSRHSAEADIAAEFMSTRPNPGGGHSQVKTKPNRGGVARSDSERTAVDFKSSSQT